MQQYLLSSEKFEAMKAAIEALKQENRDDHAIGEYGYSNWHNAGRYKAFEEVLSWIESAASPAQPPVNGEDDQGARDAAAEYADQPYIGVNAIDTRKFDAFLAGVKWAKGQASPAKAEQEGPHIRKEDIEEEWESFWKDIVCHPDGSLNIDQIKKELYDFSYVMGEVPKVYCEITGNRLSKIMYPAETVISVADEYTQSLIDRELKDYEHDVQDFVETAEPKREQEGLTWADIVAAQDEYIALLVKEIESMVGLAYAHGWRSDNHEAGALLREKISALKSTESAPKEASAPPQTDFMSFLAQHSEAGITGKITNKELKEMCEKEAGQVDPVAFAEWVTKNGFYKATNGHWYVSQSGKYLADDTNHMHKIYLESLNK